MGFFETLNKGLQQITDYKAKYAFLSTQELIDKYKSWGCGGTEKMAIELLLRERGAIR